MNLNKIKEIREQRAEELGLIICPKCGYCNRKFNVENFGTCTGCGYVIDKRIKMFYEIRKKTNIKKVKK